MKGIFDKGVDMNDFYTHSNSHVQSLETEEEEVLTDTSSGLN
jgi:hypothetical protein